MGEKSCQIVDDVAQSDNQAQYVWCAHEKQCYVHFE